MRTGLTELTGFETGVGRARRSARAAVQVVFTERKNWSDAAISPPSPVNGLRGGNAESFGMCGSRGRLHPSPSFPLPVEGRGRPDSERRFPNRRDLGAPFTAPKGRHSIAQGEALGLRHKNFLSPERAEHGTRAICPALSGLKSVSAINPGLRPGLSNDGLSGLPDLERRFPNRRAAARSAGFSTLRRADDEGVRKNPCVGIVRGVKRPRQLRDRAPGARRTIPNPNGIPSLSPGLRGTSYPGCEVKIGTTLKGLNPEAVHA